MAKNNGKSFETDIKQSCKDFGVFFYRIKDVGIPYQIRHMVPLSPNNYDCFMYSKPNLFALELKSTQGTSLSFNESIVKQHQLDSLLEASQTNGLIAGLLINFSSKGRCFFVEINEYLQYKHVATKQLKDHIYKSNINKNSIPMSICEEIGIEVKTELKRIHYRYHVHEFIELSRKRYGNAEGKQRNAELDAKMLKDMQEEFDSNFKMDSNLAEWSRSAVPELFSMLI